MRLGDKVPVPELDELRTARIERGILAEVARFPVPVPHKKRKGSGAMLIVGLALAASLLFYFQQESTNETSETVMPTLVVTGVVTGAGERTQLQLGDALVDVEQNTRVEVKRYDDGRTVLVLAQGQVRCQVDPRPNRPLFQVITGDVEVSVIGTAFRVSRSDVVDVDVEHGVVRVRTSHEDIRLGATRPKRNRDQESSAAGTATQRTRLDKGKHWQGSPFADRSLATLLDAQERVVAAAATQGQDVTPGVVPDVVPKRGTQKSVKKSSKHRAAKPSVDKEEEPKTLKQVLTGAKPMPPVHKQSHSKQLASLRQVSVTNPSKAVKDLETLAARTVGSEASFALYSRAYLLFFRLGTTPRSMKQVIRTAKQYATRFPKGAEAEDMLWLRVRASCQAGTSSTCRSSAHTYLRRYPSGIFARLATRITSTRQD